MPFFQLFKYLRVWCAHTPARPEPIKTGGEFDTAIDQVMDLALASILIAFFMLGALVGTAITLAVFSL